MRRVWLIRHGKSADPTPGQRDFDRPLKRRGHKNGQAMQRWLAQQTSPPTWVWTSPAVRAASTAEYVANSNQAHCVTEPNLYLADPETLVDVLRSTPESVEEQRIENVAVVAHNPGLTHCLNLLVGKQVTDNLVTLAAAELEFASPWSELRFGDAQLLQLVTPVDLEPNT